MMTFPLVFIAFCALLPPSWGQQSFSNSSNGGTCYSLSGSTYCGAGFGAYYMSSAAPVANSHVSDVVSFDRALEYFFGSPTDIQDVTNVLNCTSWDPTIQPRYRATYMCRALLASSDKYAQCNIANPVPSMCQSTCQVYMNGWASIVANVSMCPLTQLSMQDLNILKGACNLSPYNGTQGTCINGTTNEPSTCGELYLYIFVKVYSINS